MKRLLGVVMIMIVLGLMVACALPPTPAPTATSPTVAAQSATASPAATTAPVPAGEFKLGLNLPLTGAAAVGGIEWQRAAQMAADDVNSGGGLLVGGQRYLLKIVSEDNGFTSAGGATATTKLVSQENVKVVSALGSPAFLGSQPITEKARVILTGMTPGLVLGADKPYTVRVYPDQYLVDAAFLQWFQQQRPAIKRIATVLVDNPTGHELGDKVATLASGFGQKVTAQEYYAPDIQDFYPVLTRLLSSPPDVIAFGSSGPVPVLLKQARQLGFKGQFWALSVVPTAWVQIAGVENVEGLLSPAPDPESAVTPAGLKKFLADYKTKFKEEASEVGTTAYIETSVIAQAVEQAGTVDDTAKIVAALERGNFKTLAGDIVFGGKEVYGVNRQGILPVFITEFAQGKPKGLARVDPSTLKEIMPLLK